VARTLPIATPHTVPGDHERPDKPEEACGVFGVLAHGQAVANLTYFGLYALQHRGQESAGIAVFSGAKVRLHKDMGLVSQVFDQDVLQRMPGELAIGHNRYSTTGSSKICNAQPVVLMTRLGPFALAHNGNLVNAAELRTSLQHLAGEFTSTTDSELIAFALQQAVDGGMAWSEAISSAALRCRGAFSLVIGTPEGMFALRDGHGIRPLVFGRIGEPDLAQWVLSSESCGLDIIGAAFEDDVQPGELVWFRAGDPTPDRRRWCDEPPKLCVFEMIYFARPDSRFFGESLYSYRVRIGKTLARENPVPADIVIGVPDSGIPAAIGYSEVSGIPYGDGLIKNRYVGRTFIQPTQAMREAGIRVKLNPLPDVLAGKRVVVIDDSIVRGTTSRKLVQALREAGATEVHMRISSPPVTHPCFYGIDTDTQDHLIAARMSLGRSSGTWASIPWPTSARRACSRRPMPIPALLHRLLRWPLPDRDG
jgi:amidophosphoribosyltransferase